MNRLKLTIAATLAALPLLCGMLTSGFAGEGETVDPALSAGKFTITRFDAAAYSEPAPVLNSRQRQFFMFGRNVFHRKWAAVASLNGDWGLGPTFVASQCSQCHLGDGRGAPPLTGQEQLTSLLVKLSIPGVDAHGGPKPHPHYGDQLQNRALDGQNVDLDYASQPVPAEAEIYVEWDDQPVRFADGEEIVLRKPRLRIERLAFGALEAEVMMSLRMAQPVFGLGLLDAVSEETFQRIAQAQRAMGYSGRPNYVWDAINQRTALGRYGWKANQPSLRQQIAAAALGDMGVSTNLFSDQNCPPVQTLCRAELPGNVPEMVNHEIDGLELWMRALAVPARRNFGDPLVRRGEALFEQAQCAVCHVPAMKTASEFPALPQLANQLFHAYTDLLLHDMGDDLADGRPEFKAGPRDWRTPPLWGLGLSEVVNGSTAMLHDGRARNATEAILWHGGEAQASREAFRNMPKADREALLAFLNAI